MSSVEEDDANPLDDFFLVAGLDDLDALATKKKSLKNRVRKKRAKEDDSQRHEKWVQLGIKILLYVGVSGSGRRIE